MTTVSGLNILRNDTPYIYYKETFENYFTSAEGIDFFSSLNGEPWRRTDDSEFSATSASYLIHQDENTSNKYLAISHSDDTNEGANQTRAGIVFTQNVSENLTIELDYYSVGEKFYSSSSEYNLLDIPVVPIDNNPYSFKDWYRVWINYKGIVGVLDPRENTSP